MINTDELISDAVSLPVEKRILLINKLLESLNPAKKEIDELWAAEAEGRVSDIIAGKEKTIPGEEVFKEIRKKYNK
jgi:putative addiction module component (TIGR02574 family)